MDSLREDNSLCVEVQGRRTRKICGDFVFYSHKIRSLASRRSHETCSPPEGAKGNIGYHQICFCVRKNQGTPPLTTRGQPGLSLLIDWYTMCCARQGQPDNLFGKSAFLQKTPVLLPKQKEIILQFTQGILSSWTTWRIPRRDLAWDVYEILHFVPGWHTRYF